MVCTWWHPPIVIKFLWRKLPSEQRKSNCIREEGMPISINIIACLECSCHNWVPQLIYFDKIHHIKKKKKSIFIIFFLPFFSLFPNFYKLHPIFPRLVSFVQKQGSSSLRSDAKLFSRSGYKNTWSDISILLVNICQVYPCLLISLESVYHVDTMA
jgi:hypothetical protein